MNRQEQLLNKYNEMLIMIRHYCMNQEPITPKHITRAFKTSDCIFTVLMRKRYITQITTGRKKIFQWNRGEITESLIHEFNSDVVNHQREYLKRKNLNKRLEMTNKVQTNLDLFSQSEEKYKAQEQPKKQRRKITILWGLITF
jgi:hypothetical protein